MKHKVMVTDQGKVVIDEIEEGCKYYDGINIGTAFKNNAGFYKDCDKIIATINHSIDLDIPMVIIEDEIKKFLFKLCYYDLRNPDNCIDTAELTKEELGLPQVRGEDFANDLCTCNNCFYGKTEMAEYIINKASQQKSYSEEDLRKYHNIMCLHGNIAGEEFIQSLKQEYIELEMETSYLDWKKGDKEKLSDTLQIRTDRVDGQLMAYITFSI